MLEIIKALLSIFLRNKNFGMRHFLEFSELVFYILAINHDVGKEFTESAIFLEAIPQYM